MLKNRVAAARGFLAQFNIDAILFSDIKDVRYLTGFRGSEGLLLLSQFERYFLTDSRYTTQAAEEANGCSIIEVKDKVKDIASLIKRFGVGSVGYQAERISVAVYNELADNLSENQLVSLGSEIGTLRMIKDPNEIEDLARTAAIASDALNKLIPEIMPGVIEKDLALKLEFIMRNGGVDDKAFDFIVVSGVRGALPHGRASSKKIRKGDLLTMDFGGVMDGYNSDETVTLAVGKPDAKQREIYQVVKDAHDMAMESVRPGLSIKELDAVARDHITQKGYGDFFGHGLGHGVGLDVHEKPLISFRSEDKLQEGMVFTIEPGIYIPGWGGGQN